MSTLSIEKYIHFSFDQFPVIETGSLEVVSFNGSGSTDLLPAVFGSGILMSDSGYMSLPISYTRYQNIKSEFSVGFWLNSISLSDKIFEDVAIVTAMPIVSIGNASVINQSYVLSDGLFLIYEKCVFSKYNKMYFVLMSSGGERIEFDSEIYETGSFNHFMFSVNSEIGEVKLYINGVESILSSNAAVLPPSFGLSSIPEIYINKNIEGDVRSLEKNKGVLDDLFIISDAIRENYKISKIIADGFSAYINEVSGNISERVFDAKISLFQDASISPSISAVDISSGDIIAGTQDGIILKGDSGYWNKKYSLTSENSLNDLTVVYSSQNESGSNEESSNDGKIISGQGLVLIKNGIIIK